jgi:hypothetical protein
MGRLTAQGTRTEEQIKDQQFSTPPTESYVVAKVGAIRPTDIVLEPSAGNGGIAAQPVYCVPARQNLDDPDVLQAVLKEYPAVLTDQAKTDADDKPPTSGVTRHGSVAWTCWASSWPTRAPSCGRRILPRCFPRAASSSGRRCSRVPPCSIPAWAPIPTRSIACSMPSSLLAATTNLLPDPPPTSSWKVLHRRMGAY